MVYHHDDPSLNVFRIPHAVSLVRFSTNPKSLEFHSAYNAQQVERILNTVNSQSETELAIFNISKQRIHRIDLWKRKHGAFKTIEGILEVDGFGIKVLERFCDSILNKPCSAEPAINTPQAVPQTDAPVVVKKMQQFVQPALLESTRKTVKSCVSFHLDLSCVAWTKLYLDTETDDEIRPIHVDEWKCFQFGDEDKKLSLSDLIQILISLNRDIPHADVYVVEAQQSAQPAKQPGSPVQVNINVQKSQLLAMLSILMAARGSLHANALGSSADEYLKNNESIADPIKKKASMKQQQQIFFLKHFLASRLYKTYIGNERVSTENAIQNILRYDYPGDQPNFHTISAVNMPIHLREAYNKSSKLEREFMGQSLLNGLTFFKLCVLKCAQSTVMLGRFRKSN